MPFFSIVKEKLDAKARAAQQEEQGEEGEEGETAATVARVEQQGGEAPTGGQQSDGQGEVAADDAAGATTEQIQAASEAGTSSDASAKRQKKGKGRMTAKRRQNKDEKEKKISAKEEFAAATKASSATVQNPCPRCKSAAARLDDEATALIEGHADPVAAQDDPEVERLRAEAKARLELAYTHARPTNQLCPDYIKRKSVKTKERLGKTRRTTIKHGLASLLSNDITDDDQRILLDGIHNIVTFNRHLAINAILFTQKYVIDILHSGGHVPRALFTQAFFIAVFQLILGNPVSNKALFADNDTRTAFLQAFDQFKIEHPQIHMNKLVGVNGKPNGFATVTDYTAIQLATMMKNHVVENFEIFFMRSLAAKFAMDHPDLKPHHCRSYAMYAYDKACKDELFPPELPDYKKMKAEQKEQLKNDADDLAQHAEGKLARVGDFVVEEKAQIAEASRKRQETNDRARDMSLANRNAIIAALTFSSPAPPAPPAPEMVAAESSAGAQAAAAAAQEAAIAAHEAAIAAQEAAIAEAAALQDAALQSARDRAAELHAAAAEAQVAAMAQAQEMEFAGNVAATMHIAARNTHATYNACAHAANSHHANVIPSLAAAASAAHAALGQAPAAMAAIAQESFRQADQAYRGALDYSAILIATVENAQRNAEASHLLAQEAAQVHATAIALSTAKNAAAEAAGADASAADARVASIMAAMAAASGDNNNNDNGDDDEDHPMEMEPLDDDDVSMMHASDAMSTSTVGAAAMAQLHVSHNASVTTAILTKYPHFFIKVLYDALKEMEAWNDDNAARPAQVATEATYPWTKHQLEEKVPAWEDLNYRRRSRLTRIITKIINDKDHSLDITRLPYQKQLDDRESQEAIKDIVTETKHKIKNNTFMPEIYIARPAIRLFSVVPSLSFRLRYIHWSHKSLLGLLTFLGLTKYKQGTTSAPDDGSVHPVFDRLFNWTKIRK
ncbi:hypothetical protein BC940DRAFT_150064 [Gongronella butleri]|nr:hypothetical protein BC940DRAFT_150064 [Gongronella butleri]